MIKPHVVYRHRFFIPFLPFFIYLVLVSHIYINSWSERSMKKTVCRAAKLGLSYLVKGRHTARGDKSQGHVASCELSIFCRDNLVLSPRHVPSIQTGLNSGVMSWRQNFVTPRHENLFTRGDLTRGGDMSPRQIPSCVPTLIIWRIVFL